MNFEVVHGKYEQKNLAQVASGQLRPNARVELQTPCKKVLSVTARCFLNGVERAESEARVSGKIVTRVIYIDETDAFNSEERSDPWTEKFSLKNPAEIVALVPSGHVLETKWAENAKNEGGFATAIKVDHVVNVNLMGVMAKEARYVSDLKGEVERKCEKASVSTFGQNFHEKFEISETFGLDSNVEGILGVELNATVRDILCNDGKIVIKGTACANVVAVKNVDGPVMFNTFYDWDFSKTLNAKDIGPDSAVCGNVLLSNVVVKVENREKVELVIEAEVVFMGNSVTRHEIEVVEDAFSYDHVLDFSYGEAGNILVTPQANISADVEGNVTMPEGAAFISKILSVCGMNVNSVNVNVTTDKVTIEGVLAATLAYECEEKHTYSHIAQVPFSVVAKIDGISREHDISVAVTPMSCNIKARRGKELLVDARLGVNVCGSIFEPRKIVSDVGLGEAKKRDDSAIIIHIAGEKENLWDIAKRTSIPSAEIIRQNPGVENGIADGERIVLYRQEVISF